MGMLLNSAKLDQGNELYRTAERYLLAGSGAPPRIYPLIGRPLYLKRADGAYLHDVDGNKFIDFHNSSGATLIGHNHPAMKAAIERALDLGFFCNFESEYHAQLGKLICDMVPSAETVRFCSSGTESTAGVMRIARAFTGRSRILKFEGHYHGQHDYAYFNTDGELGVEQKNGEIAPAHASAGVPEALDGLVTIIPFNKPEVFLETMGRHKGEFAAVLMEPVMYNAGCILPDRDFVELVRAETTRDGAVLIFDEVLSGFRMAPGGGQEYLGITPDLSCLSKALGGGMPISAIAGKREVMSVLTPYGKTVISSTYTGHLISIMGAVAALEEIGKPDFYKRLNALSDRLYSGINEILNRRKVKAVCQGLGARFGMFFGLDELPIMDFRKAVRQYDVEASQKFVRLCFERGLYFRDAGRRIVPIHNGISSAHTENDIDETLSKLDDLFENFETK
jgi:glutamate-1-semialdehyde 2,1-aminomutase